jgi:hypothetical protein
MLQKYKNHRKKKRGKITEKSEVGRKERQKKEKNNEKI